MKTHFKFGLILTLFFALTSSVGAAPETSSPNTDDPAGYFLASDLCGFLEGNSNINNNNNGSGQVQLERVYRQGCADENGYFYRNDSRLVQEGYNSQAIYSRVSGVDAGKDFTMDFTWSNNPRHYVNIDLTTGAWSGFAELEGLPRGALDNETWVDFEWTCTDPICDQVFYDTWRVHTDMNTGETAGLAWNDRYGYIAFGNLTWELPPKQVDVYVDFFANDIIDADGVQDEPNHVNFTSAPLADGYEHWRVRMQLFDRFTGVELGSNFVTSVTMDITETADSQIYMNQVLETGESNSTIVESDHPSIPECTDANQACQLTEDDGSDSFNIFVSSGAPTSNTLGMRNNANTLIENFVDRGGCTDFYLEDPWNEVCANPNLDPNVFYDRSGTRNKFEVDTVDVHLDFDESIIPERDMILYVNDVEYSTDNTYVYDFSFVPSEDKKNLSFRPLTSADRFEVIVHQNPDVAQTTIPTADQTEMSYEWDLTYEPNSQAYADATGAFLRAGYDLYLRLGNDNYEEDPTDRKSLHLIAFNDEQYTKDYVGWVDGTHSFPSGLPFYHDGGPFFTSAAGGVINGSVGGAHNEILKLTTDPLPSDTLTKPTAELYICDNLNSLRFPVSNESCYFLSYMPREDILADPEPMEVIGAIKATQDATDFFSDTPGLSVLGSADSLLVRNKIYSQVLQYTVGETAGECTIDENFNPTNTSDVVSLFGGRLIYCEGDVTINGSTAFSNTTVVTVGGNIYLEGDLTGGQAGLIALTNELGTGGNMYVAPNVTDIQAQIFLDGSLHSFEGDNRPGATPYWDSEKRRLEILRNQLHLLGSLTSRNTIGGSDGVAPFDLGDGTTSNFAYIAKEYDLNKLRRFRLCYDVDLDTGLLDTNTKVLCEQGEQLSAYGIANDVYASFIIEGEAPSGLPIFNSR